MGSACAAALAPTVEVVLLTDRHEDRLAQAAARLEGTSAARVDTLAGDLADPATVDRLTGRVAELGTLRALVHTAGLSPSMASWPEILALDLVAPARLLDACAPLVVPTSVAVALASISGRMGTFEPAMDAVLDQPLADDLEARFEAELGRPPDPGSTYRLAKRGVIRLCQRAALAWGAGGGRVVSVSPGLIDTPMGRQELAENPIKHDLARRTPIRSPRGGPDGVLPGQVADVARAVAFLCSAQAGFITGCDLLVDGGLLAALEQPG